MNLTPLEDGVSHINVYSRGKTELGRCLTNPAPISFDHPKYGTFDNVEGFHFFLKTGAKDYNYATINGFEARRKGKSEVGLYKDLPEFDVMMRAAWLAKILQNRKLYRDVLENNLPLTHYYFYGKEDNCKVITTESNFITNLTEVCNFLKGQ
jgi:hypothetical protein